VTLDVFLESETGFDREAAEATFARNGVPADSTVTTADGGEASVSIDDDGAVVVIESLTPDSRRSCSTSRAARGWRSCPRTGRRTRSSPAKQRCPMSWNHCTWARQRSSTKP